MILPRAIALRVAAIVLAGLGCVAASASDDYTGMLGYLAECRIDQRAFSGASGSIAINQASGDHNLQANLRAIATGRLAHASADARQLSADVIDAAPTQAQAVIAGTAFRGASGLVSINQASGAANAGLNAVTAALAQQGIREAGDEFLSSSGVASAGVQTISEPGTARTQARKVGVEGSALQGFNGVLQLNQVAGVGNATENRVQISVQGLP